MSYLTVLFDSNDRFEENEGDDGDEVMKTSFSSLGSRLTLSCDPAQVFQVGRRRSLYGRRRSLVDSTDDSMDMPTPSRRSLYGRRRSLRLDSHRRSLYGRRRSLADSPDSMDSAFRRRSLYGRRRGRSMMGQNWLEGLTRRLGL